MNTQELQAEIIRKGKSNHEVIRKIGISPQAFYNKMQERSEFKGSEILKITKLLDLSLQQVNDIFFDNEVN